MSITAYPLSVEKSAEDFLPCSLASRAFRVEGNVFESGRPAGRNEKSGGTDCKIPGSG